jgi:Flp pilus assembly protein TadG
MIRPVRSGRQRRKGQALVEFCFSLPLLLMILLATIEFGRLYAVWYTVEQAAFEGARLVAESDGTMTAAEVKQRVDSILINIDGATVQPPVVTLDSGEVSVTIRAEVDILVPTNIGRFRLFNSDKVPIAVTRTAKY